MTVQGCGPTDTPQDIDIEAMRAKYAVEREKRVRTEGASQYLELKDDFAEFAEVDPHTTVTPRDPIDADIEVAVLGGGIAGLLAGAYLKKAGEEQKKYDDKGAEISNGDTIRTGDGGRAQVRFSDGALISLQPTTEFRVDNYEFSNQPTGQEKGFFSLIKGGMRTITGLIGRSNRDNYKVTTSVATIGIRGTGCYIEAEAKTTYFCLCYGEAAIEGADEAHRQLGDGDGVHARTVADADAHAGRGADVDVVDAVAEIGDHLELAVGLIDHVVADQVGDRRHQHVGGARGLRDLVGAHGLVVEIEPRVEQFAHPGLGRIRQLAGDDDERLFLDRHILLS